ncbi:hypothetical protein Hanom_Chr08g00732011 [Helianthus anomalus]
MSKMDPVPNRYRYRIYRTGYLFGTGSVPTFDIFGTGSVPVRYGTGSVPVFTGFYPQIPVLYRYRTSTGTKPYRTRYIRYLYRYPLLVIFGTSSFGTGTGRYRAHPYFTLNTTNPRWLLRNKTRGLFSWFFGLS